TPMSRDDSANRRPSNRFRCKLRCRPGPRPLASMGNQRVPTGPRRGLDRRLVCVVDQPAGGGVEKIELATDRGGMAAIGKPGKLEQVFGKPKQDDTLPRAGLANLVE